MKLNNKDVKNRNAQMDYGVVSVTESLFQPHKSAQFHYLLWLFFGSFGSCLQTNVSRFLPERRQSDPVHLGCVCSNLVLEQTHKHTDINTVSSKQPFLFMLINDSPIKEHLTLFFTGILAKGFWRNQQPGPSPTQSSMSTGKVDKLLNIRCCTVAFC